MIDFEYGGPNYLAYDIADHFCEFAGTKLIIYNLYIMILIQSLSSGGEKFVIFLHFCPLANIGVENVDYGRYPDESLQKLWLRMYLEEAAKLRGMLVYHS